MSQTATILAEMRQANADAIQTFSETVDDRVAARGARMRRSGVIRAGGPRTVLATSAGRREALAVSSLLLKGCEAYDQNNDRTKLTAAVRRVKNQFRSNRGRQTPDMLEAVLSFFKNPSDITERALVTALPIKVAAATAKVLAADPFFVDVVEGLGYSVPTNMAGWVRSINPASSHAGGRPRKVRLTARWDSDRAPIHTCHFVGGIPTSESGIAAGPGFDQGKGWSEAWSKGRALSLPQIARRNAALDEFHLACSRQAEADEA